MYCYTLYGMAIDSAFELPELLPVPATGTADVQVVRGAVAAPSAAGAAWDEEGMWAVDGRFWLPVEGVATFLVEGGGRITVDAVAGADEASIRLFLLGSAIGALLFQRDYLVLHGNAIRIGDACLVCVGDSGVGKSTLAAAFMQAGYSILADDVVPVTAEGLAIPGMPRIKLWQDAADRLGIATAGLRRIHPDMEKFNVPLGERFCAEPLPVRWVCWLVQGEPGSATTVEAVTGLEGFRVLAENTYRYHYLKRMGLLGSHLQQCAALAGKVRIKKITRPPEGAEPGELVSLLLRANG